MIGASMGESYGSRTRFDMLDALDFEEGLAMADTLAEAADRLDSGEQVSGAAAARYVATAREFIARFPGRFMTKRQLRALLADPRLRVYDNPQAFLSCNYDPFKALCDPGRTSGTGEMRTPSLSRCHKSCANISRTDTHIAGVRREIARIEDEVADDALPTPLGMRLRQRAESLRHVVARHEAVTIPPPRQAEEPMR